jgi:hypothetical protein
MSPPEPLTKAAGPGDGGRRWWVYRVRDVARSVTQSVVAHSPHGVYLGTTQDSPAETEPCPRFDRHRQAWLSLLRSALAEGGVEARQRDRPWGQPPVLYVDADRSKVFEVLRAVHERHSGTMVQRIKTSSPAVELAARATATVVGIEFAAARLPLTSLGRPAELAGTPPSGSRWLVTRHVQNPTGSRTIGTEAGVEICFAPPAPPSAMVDFPIDAVYTWVDADDPQWRTSYLSTPPGRNLTQAATESARFHQADELRFSLRSISEFAPWIRHIWLVTAGQRPDWLRDDPRISVIDHRDIWPEPEQLPTFNSQAIEANLHRISGLADHYLYFNDDFFLGRPVSPEQFFTPDGKPKAFLSTATVPVGDPVPSDLAPDASGKNNRRLVARVTGQELSWKYQHTPQALSRSLVTELEEHFADEFKRTSASRFRSTTDITVSGGLHHAYGLATNQVESGRIRYRYVDLDRPEFRRRLQGLLSYRYYETFCLNSVAGPFDLAAVIEFLEAYYPCPSDWELGGEGSSNDDGCGK